MSNSEKRLICYQYLRRAMPLADVLKPWVVSFLFMFYSFSWFCVSNLWKL